MDFIARAAEALLGVPSDLQQVLSEPGLLGGTFWIALGLAAAIGLLWALVRAWLAYDRAFALVALPAALVAIATTFVAVRWMAPDEHVGLLLGQTLRTGAGSLAAIAFVVLVAVVAPRLQPMLARGFIALVVLLPLLALVAGPRRPAPPGEAEPVVQREGMVRIPAGWFVRGSVDPAQLTQPVGTPAGDERPVREIWLDAFWIDSLEVTNAKFAAFVEARDYVTDVERVGSGKVWLADGWHEVKGAYWREPTGPDSSIEGRADHPVVQVGWNDAAAYCEWAKKRLPTEAEWEKAARGSDARDYPWGSDFDSSRLNFCDRRCPIPVQRRDATRDDGFEFTAPVGSFPSGASPYGVLDMSGNVWEWVADWYHPDYYAFSTDRNPRGPGPGRFASRVVRGGSFAAEPGYLRTTSRSFDPPRWGFYGVGFRCARDAEPEERR